MRHSSDSKGTHRPYLTLIYLYIDIQVDEWNHDDQTLEGDPRPAGADSMENGC